MLRPENEQELIEIVNTHSGLQPFGGGSKPALSALFDGATGVDMRGLSGILAYDPNEYTFTARAGTAVSEIIDALAEKGQYLPFDPLFVQDGATLGGTVAANTSGSGRFRYGGVRDFILGVRFVDGNGRIVNGGGKVVKNAAGFDLPKFMTGSLGRYGILTEITFKVFPKPRLYHTLELQFKTLDEALAATYLLANQPYEMDALDMRPNEAGVVMWVRVGGLMESLAARVSRLSGWFGEKTAVLHINKIEDDRALWQAINRCDWRDEASLVKVPIAPKQLPTLHKCNLVTNAHYSAAGNVAWLSVSDLVVFDAILSDLKLLGLVLNGVQKRPYVGQQTWLPFARRIKTALDPHGKFLEV